MSTLKRLPALLLALALVPLAACGQDTTTASPDLQPRTPKEVGVAPYDLTAGEEYVLRLTGDAQLFSFRAPEGAVFLRTNILRLEDDGTWTSVGGGGCSLGTTEPDVMAGALSLECQPDGSIDLAVGLGSTVATSSSEPQGAENLGGCSIAFLREHTAVRLDEELPIAIWAYTSGNTLPTVAPAQYFDPAELTDLDLVLAVTIVFSGQAL